MAVAIPACPRCGCNYLLEVAGATARWRSVTDPRTGKPWGGSERKRVECDHCGKRFDVAADEPEAAAPEPEIPRYDPAPAVRDVRRSPPCPECRSARTRVTSTRRPVRHHKCRDCNHCFKSIEKK